MTISKPIYLATHPRSASTAFERSFMSRKDISAIHEPFGEPFYYGPEKMSDRYPGEELEHSEYKTLTYKQVYDSILNESKDMKTIFIKDMAQYIIPSDGTGELARSFGSHYHNNPTVLPDSALNSFKFVFLIRSPHLSVPSYYSCCIPPKAEKTGFDHYRTTEAGYRELRILFDYLDQVPLVIDAEDLGAYPKEIMEKVCESVGVPFDNSMLSWEANDKESTAKFAKWNGFHDDALNSTGFRKSRKVSPFTVDWQSWEDDWRQKFDPKGVSVIKESVEKHLDDYLYLRQFKIVV